MSWAIGRYRPHAPSYGFIEYNGVDYFIHETDARTLDPHRRTTKLRDVPAGSLMIFEIVPNTPKARARFAQPVEDGEVGPVYIDPENNREPQE